MSTDKEWWPPRAIIPQADGQGTFYNFYVQRGSTGYNVLVHQHQDGRYHGICDEKGKEFHVNDMLELRLALLSLVYAERTVLSVNGYPPN